MSMRPLGFVLACLSLTLAACATPPPTQTAGPSTNASASNFLACMVSDEGACRIWWSSGVRPSQAGASAPLQPA